MKLLKYENYIIIREEVKKYDDLTCMQKEWIQDTMLEKVLREVNFEKVTGKNNQINHGKT